MTDSCVTDEQASATIFVQPLSRSISSEP